MDYPNNIIMNKNAKKMYVAPSIKEHVVELEQGIAAGSGSVEAQGWGSDIDNGSSIGDNDGAS